MLAMTTAPDAKYKYQKLKNCLLQRIADGVYRCGEKISSEPALSREFGLSRNTIRLAIQELEAAGVLYRIQGKGTFVCPKAPEAKRKIGLIIYDISYATHPLTSQLIRGIDSVLSENGYLLDILASQRNSQEENMEQLAEHYAGFLIGAYQIDQLILQKLSQLMVPYLFVKNYQPARAADTVRCNFYQAGYLAAEHLIQNGRTDLALVCGNSEVAIFQEYRSGVTDCCLENGAQLRRRNIYEIDPANPCSRLSEIVNCLTAESPLPDGLLVIDDQIAADLMYQLQNRQIRIPEDIAVAGCNNMEISRLTSPPLTTIEIPTFELGRTAAMELLNRLNGQAEFPAPLPVKLVVRESTLNTNQQYEVI